MDIPEPNNVSNVLVDGEMWHTEARNGQPGWAALDDGWLDVADFQARLDEAHTVTFYSPTGRVINPE